MPTLFTQIINGDIPCYKIYEDEKTFAFLDIHPETRGHTLVVPKLECDKLYALPDDYYFAVMSTVKKLSAHYDQVLGARTLLKVVGTDVPHAHVHLMPLDESWQHGVTLDLTEAEFQKIQQKLRLD